MVEQADHHYLPMNIAVDWCIANPKAKVVLLNLVNTKNHNIQLWQPLLAAKLHSVYHHPWEYKTIIDQEENNIKTWFQTFPLYEINAVIYPGKEKQQPAAPQPTFGSRPNTSSKDFDFQGEIQSLSFKLNLGANAKLTQEQQARFINVIYDNWEVFSLFLKSWSILWNSTLVLLEDKLSSTTVDFIRSDWKLKTKCLY